jgi:hypothetical protein
MLAVPNEILNFLPVGTSSSTDAWAVYLHVLY